MFCLNTDGSSINGTSSGGGVIGTYDGSHVSNFFSFYGRGPNNYAETRALLEGECIMLEINNVQIQCGSGLAIH